MEYQEFIAESTENKRIILITDIHNCHEDWYKTENEARMCLMCDALKREYDISPYDLILCLGDYSLDFWGGVKGGSYLWNPPISRTAEFMEKYYPRFPAPTYIIPGNHEQYGADTWRDVTGFEREYSVVYGDTVFVMLDTFAGKLSPTENSDGVYSGINLEFLKSVLYAHPDKKIILCAHYFDPTAADAELKSLIVENPRIRCIFVGHRHISTAVVLDESWRGFPVFFCGNFSYHRLGKAPDYFGNVYHSFMDGERGHWGYRILNLRDGNICTDYVQV